LQPTIATSDIYYYPTNHLGSTAFVTDQNQNVTQGFLYAPYGEITTEFDANFGSDIIPKYSFNAKELDEETGMYYYEARYYKPPVFTSRDAMFEKKPWLSPYQYCSNNPVGRVDPSGCEDEITWVKKENGAIVFNSDVHDQADAESYYGENAECLYIGFQYKTKSGKECKLLENGYYLENGIKKKAPNEAPLFKKIGNAIKRFDEGGSYDGANMGTITPKDWKVGFAVVGVFAGAGATVETVAAGKVLSAVVSGLGTANCIDDACVNSEGKTPLERSMGEYSSVADYLKLGVNTANVVNGTYNWVKYSAESFNVASTVTSTVSTGQGAAKEIKK
ncbi:MAG: RHS repeat-associated core domain-containing protein, partial [Bacteroidales bacterium]|nr:RHS repeat-associated core domain-containing protein [Bacteroidales bacterium]